MVRTLRRIIGIVGTLAVFVLGGMVLNEAGAYAADGTGNAKLNLNWAKRAFSDGKSLQLQNQLVIVHEETPGETKVDLGNGGGPIRLGDKTYKRGIGVNSPSVLRVVLSKPAASFKSVIGLDRNVDGSPASVRFYVKVADKNVFSTDVIRPGAAPQNINIPLNGAQTFDLVVDEGGDSRSFDQGDWAEARVVLNDGSEVWLDDLARLAVVSDELPFSFVYGGRPSSELLKSWTKSVKDETINAGTFQRTLTLTDPVTHLEVKAIANIYTDTGGVDWTLHFTNNGSEDTPIIEKVNAVDVTVNSPMGSFPVLHRLHGSARGAECAWQPMDDTLSAGQNVSFGAIVGRTALGNAPFFNLQWQGGGVITSVGWAGQWTASCSKPAMNTVRINVGMQYMHLKLHPGETIHSPRIMQCYWSGDSEADSYNVFRRTMFAHIMPRIGGKVLTPPLVGLAPEIERFPGDKVNEYSAAAAIEDIQYMKGLGYEYYWIDAFYARDGFPSGMGNYGIPLSIMTDPKRFPDGMEPVSEAVHKAGMKLIVWFEPERVAPGTYIAKNYSQYVISPGKDGSGLFDLGNPDARKYMTDVLSAAIEKWNISGLRIDYNLLPLPYWQLINSNDPDRVGICEIRYMEGLYQMWDDLLRRHPNMFIDNCASGGTRVDLETCSRSIPLWRTDDTIGPFFAHDYDQTSILNQTMSAGLSRYVPFNTSGQIGSDPYDFRSGFNGCVTLVDRPTKEKRAEMKAAFAEARRLRKYYFGDFYALTDVNMNPTTWCVMQYNRPKDGDGMIVAFRRNKSPFTGLSLFGLHGINPEALYEVTQSLGYKQSAPVKMKGSQLLDHNVEIDHCPGSVIIEYRRINK